VIAISDQPGEPRDNFAAEQDQDDARNGDEGRGPRHFFRREFAAGMCEGVRRQYRETMSDDAWAAVFKR